MIKQEGGEEEAIQATLYVYAVYNTKYMVSRVQQYIKFFLFENVIK